MFCSPTGKVFKSRLAHTREAQQAREIMESNVKKARGELVDERPAKRQKVHPKEMRMRKNRESAQRSRVRKQNERDLLEKNCIQLSYKNDVLTNMIETLQPKVAETDRLRMKLLEIMEENNRLKTENYKMKVQLCGSKRKFSDMKMESPLTELPPSLQIPFPSVPLPAPLPVPQMDLDVGPSIEVPPPLPMPASVPISANTSTSSTSSDSSSPVLNGIPPLSPKATPDSNSAVEGDASGSNRGYRSDGTASSDACDTIYSMDEPPKINLPQLADDFNVLDPTKFLQEMGIPTLSSGTNFPMVQTPRVGEESSFPSFKIHHQTSTFTMQFPGPGADTGNTAIEA